ncbi:hypothetical protein [Kineococcus sp. SYSU DK006]|uniref:hypothetical protein n=1 Tax=Kineococcus sp. SYSU DK006 TaxID=3383127 RepID=UPI003D7DA5A7
MGRQSLTTSQRSTTAAAEFRAAVAESLLCRNVISSQAFHPDTKWASTAGLSVPFGDVTTDVLADVATEVKAGVAVGVVAGVVDQ